ncbi:MAG: zinc-dependent metalloprotease [Bdellovibrio sp.]
MDDEVRLKDNSTNQKVVMEIPVQHVEYRCNEDRYKKCTNQEEENTEINWSKKHKFIPSFDSLKMVGINIIPVEMDLVFGGSCFTEVSSRFLDYKITGDSLNIQVEKIYRGDFECLEKKGIMLTDLGELQTQVVQHYSFIKLSSLTSPGYKAVTYPVSDENEFGFFTAEHRKYDVDFNRLEQGKIQYLRRWNPERKEIVYYLSDNFNKPELKSIKKSTELAFAKINNGLAAAGIQTRLVLKDPANKQPGDIRNNMIVLIEDPIVGGPLGYGPSAYNPRTGEIVSARVAMYYGNFLSQIKYTYNEVVKELRYEATKKNQEASANLAQAFTDSLASRQGMLVRSHSPLVARTSAKMSAQFKNKLSSQRAQGQNMTTTKVASLARISPKRFEKEMLTMNKSYEIKDRLSAMSKHCNYPAELFPFDEAIRIGLQGKLGTELKTWEDLNETERKEVIALIAPEIWLPTLVHELGHNLGLRHNFGGSEDKDNFYSKEELAKMGVRHEIPYSSVMDYGYSELNQLPTLGKYDIAALRFAYKREVESSTGEVKAIKTSLADLKKKDNVAIKEYKYCSDEHVDVNPNCKRFDKGTSFSEIVDYLASSYEDFYKRRNFRNQRENFSLEGDAGYAKNMEQRFMYIRAFMERYESVKHRFGMSDDAAEWNEIPFLKDLKEAAVKSGQFFLKVLETPELSCVVANSSTGAILGVQPLDSFSKEAMSCFDIEMKPGFKMAGQYGKSFNHRKDPNSDNHYVDQIDVRGIYIDKILAAKALFQRKTGNFSYDRDDDNYLNVPELRDSIIATVNGLLIAKATTKANVLDKDGQVLAEDVPVLVGGSYAPSDIVDKVVSHWIQPSYSKEAATLLGLPLKGVSFQEVMLNVINKSLSQSQQHWFEDKAFLDNFKIVRTNKVLQLDHSSSDVTRNEGSLRLTALPENTLAGELILIGNYFDLLDALSPEETKKLAEELNAGTVTSFSGPVTQIPPGLLASYLKGEIDRDVLKYLPTILPLDNQSF